MVAALTALTLTPVWILLDGLRLDFTAWLPGVPPSISNGVLPAALLLAAFVGYYRYLKKRYSATNNETIQSSFVLLMVVFLVLTVTGVWFRGAGMALVWSWNL